MSEDLTEQLSAAEHEEDHMIMTQMHHYNTDEN